MITQAAQLNRSYAEPWPWLLMSGPAIVVVAGLVTAYIAIVTNDGVVADDYYKRGLAINQTLSRDAAAQKLNYHARVEFAAEFGRVSVSFGSGAPKTQQLVLRLAHPGRPALDRLLPLTREQDGQYTAKFPALTPGRWQVTLEDAARTWRLVDDVVVPGRAVIELAPR